MRDRLKEAFDQVRAEEELKEKTKAFVRQKTDGRARQKGSMPRRLLPAIACLVLLLFGGGAWLFGTPTVTISIDINPSIELGVNRFGQVVTVKGYNDDGAALADSIQVKYRDYGDAVSQILANQKIAALLSDGAVMSIGVIGLESAQSEQILADLESCTRSQENAYCYSARPEDAKAAHELGLSTGKYRAYLELQALDPTITPEEVQQMTMREIRDRIASLSDENRAGAQPDGHNGSGNHGSGKGYGRQNAEADEGLSIDDR